MSKDIQNIVADEFRKTMGCAIEHIEKLEQSGSSRQYYKIIYEGKTCIGTYNADTAENRSFLAFSQHFAKHKLPVPQILGASTDKSIYFQEYLGSDSLFDTIGHRDENRLNKAQMELCQQVLDDLSRFQIDAAKDFDFSQCFSARKFDERLLRWDLNYFKYCFVKLAKVVFNESKLEDDLNTLVDYWNQIPANYFVYRDFQSRNIMIVEGRPHYIDYQGGIEGPLQYDVAAFLYQARLRLTEATREQLLDYYTDIIGRKITIDPVVFKQQFYVVAFVRILQTLGAYGFRGLHERKEHFIKSIPPAIKGLGLILSKLPDTLVIPELRRVCASLLAPDIETTLGLKKRLRVTIQSFAYRRGIPVDTTGNGGGYTFDCRAIPNPGIYDEYKRLIGNEEPVRRFFENTPAMHAFLNNVFSLVDMHVNRYIERGFSDLTVCFGCTGGQHRSVYAAEELAKHLRDKFDIDINLHHIEQEMKNNQEHYMKSAK